LAKVAPNGSITCLICQQAVKSAKVWTAHVNGRQHRLNVEALKQQTLKRPPSESTPAAAETAGPPPAAKKQKTNNNDIPTDFFDDSKPKTKVQPKEMQEKLAKLIGAADLEPDSPPKKSVKFSDEVEEEKEEKSGPKTPWHMETKEEKPPPVPNTAEALPEGFFDDPKIDAKIRHTEPKRDPMDVEYEKFQKVLREETTTSEAIVEEDENRMNFNREIDEIDEQMHEWERVNQLQNQKDSILEPSQSQPGMEFGDENVNEEAADANLDLDSLLDWRSKQF